MELTDLLTGAFTKSIGKSVGVDSDKVGDILANAVPTLLKSMTDNAKDEKGAQSLTKALLDHAEDDDDVEKVDQEDGAKIIDHILGDRADTVKKNLAEVAGDVDLNDVTKVLSTAAPLLMGALGNQTKSRKEADNQDLGDLLGGILGDALGSNLSSSSGGQKSKKDQGIDLGDTLEKVQAVGDILGKILK